MAGCQNFSNRSPFSFTIVKKDLIHSGIERYKISTISSGTVNVELSLVFKHFRKFNIHFD